MTKEERKAKKKAKSHAYYLRHRDEIIRKNRERTKSLSKEKRSEYRRKNYLKHRERYLADGRKHYAENRKAINERRKKQRKPEWGKRYYEKLKSDPVRFAKKKATDKAWKKSHKESTRESHRKYIKSHPEKAKQYGKTNYLRHRDDRLKYAKEYREKHREELREYQRQLRVRTRRDPELWAIYCDKLRERYSKNREKIRASNAKYRATHKGRLRKNRVWYRDRVKVLCRQDPTYYAMLRAKDRDYRIKYRAKKGILKPYRPMLSRRIPDTCCYDQVLDTRSMFLWNNQPAASLMAGRAFKRLQWMDVHCDRFGEVCR